MSEIGEALLSIAALGVVTHIMVLAVSAWRR